MGEQKYKMRALNDNLRFLLTSKKPQWLTLVQYVRDNLPNGKESVAMCFRGSYICLYYRCQKLLEIKKDKNTGKIIALFDFNHAKFIRDDDEYEQILHDLKDTYRVKGFDSDFESKKSHPIYFDFFEVSKNDLVNILNLYKKITDSYATRPERLPYRFGAPTPKKEGQIPLGKTYNNLEKDRQQEIFAENFMRSDRIIYDVEYIEPKNKEVEGRFDMLGIMREGDQYYLELIELKSLEKSCRDEKNKKGVTSGVKKHVRDYQKYLKNEALVNTRIREAKLILEDLKTVFGIPFGLANLPIIPRIRFIFTDDAAKLYDTTQIENEVEVTIDSRK